MMVNGKWLENISCKTCRYRHPAELSCSEAADIAQAERNKARNTYEPADPFEQALRQINSAMAWDEAQSAIIFALEYIKERMPA